MYKSFYIIYKKRLLLFYRLNQQSLREYQSTDMPGKRAMEKVGNSLAD